MVNINEMKMIGGKTKNGHKMDCGCHICKNMEAKAQRHGYEEDIEKEQERKMGGPQKKNGHKKDCGCPICANMKNAKKNTKSMKKKSNGHKFDCGCPICKNTKSMKNNNTKSMKKKSNGHKFDCGCPICKNMKKKMGGEGLIEEESDDKEEVADKEQVNDKEEESDDIKEVADKEEVFDDKEGLVTNATDEEADLLLKESRIGGSRKTKKSNGHKPNCGCPICKNMKKTRRNMKKRNSKRRR